MIHFPKKNFKKVDKLLKNLKKLPKMNGQNLASLVSKNKRYLWDGNANYKINLKKLKKNLSQL